MEIVLFQMQQYQGASPERAQLLEILTHVLYGLDASDEALVFKCSEKIYQEMPALVIRCFIDEEGMIGHLNIYHVVQHLQRLTAGKPTVAERNQLVIQYLAVVTPHLAAFATEQAPDHNLCHMLAVLYIESLHDFMVRTPDAETEKQVASLRAALQALLQGKGSYLPEPLLEMIKPEGLPEERCVGAWARREA